MANRRNKKRKITKKVKLQRRTYVCSVCKGISAETRRKNIKVNKETHVLKCENVGCTKTFSQYHLLTIHQGNCQFKVQSRECKQPTTDHEMNTSNDTDNMEIAPLNAMSGVRSIAAGIESGGVPSSGMKIPNVFTSTGISASSAVFSEKMHSMGLFTEGSRSEQACPLEALDVPLYSPIVSPVLFNNYNLPILTPAALLGRADNTQPSDAIGGIAIASNAVPLIIPTAPVIPNAPVAIEVAPPVVPNNAPLASLPIPTPIPGNTQGDNQTTPNSTEFMEDMAERERDVGNTDSQTTVTDSRASLEDLWQDVHYMDMVLNLDINGGANDTTGLVPSNPVHDPMEGDTNLPNGDRNGWEGLPENDYWEYDY